MRKLFICENTDCGQTGIEYVLTDPMLITTCGGCGSILIGNEVNE